MSGIEHGKRVLKILSCIDSMLVMQELAIQVMSSDEKDLLEDAAKADETLLYVDDRDLARILFEKIGNTDVAEEAPALGEEIVALGKAKTWPLKAPPRWRRSRSTDAFCHGGHGFRGTLLSPHMVPEGFVFGL